MRSFTTKNSRNFPEQKSPNNFLSAGSQAQLLLRIHSGRGDRELLPIRPELVAQCQANGEAAGGHVPHVSRADPDQGDLHKRL